MSGTDAEDRGDPASTAHARALGALREVAGQWSGDRPPADLPPALAQAVGDGTALDSDGLSGLACQYLFGARVGAQVAADPDRAVAWVSGWSAAPARRSAEVATALAAGIAFGQRVADLLRDRDPDSRPPAT